MPGTRHSSNSSSPMPFLALP
ncbi:hypothetical protein LEMLEM_LOCUS5511 [Lemmus lemmus]